MSLSEHDDRSVSPDVLNHLLHVARQVGRSERVKVQDQLCKKKTGEKLRGVSTERVSRKKGGLGRTGIDLLSHLHQRERMGILAREKL